MKLSRRNLSFIAPIIIVLVTMVSYLNGVNGDFVFDDIPLVATDSFYSNTSTTFTNCWQRAYWCKNRSLGHYRPLTITSFWLNAKITGINSPKFRIVNLILHVIISLLVFKLGIKLRLGKLTSFSAAILFGVLPLHSEAVIPTSGRAELLCALFILIGLIFYIKYGVSGAKALLAPIFLLLACWSKENGIVLLPLCLLYDIIYRDILSFFSKGKNSLLLKIEQVSIAYGGFFVALILLIFSRFAGVGTLLPVLNKKIHWIDNPLIISGWGERILTAMKVQGIVIAKYFWPAVLSHDYSYAQILPIANFADFYLLLALFTFIILPVILCFMLPNRRKLILFFTFAYFISILPAGNFIIPSGTIFGERLYYFPSIWFCFAITFVIVQILQKHRLLFAFGVPFLLVVIFASGWRIWIRSEDWKSQMSIAIKGVETAPRSVKTWQNLTTQFANIGELDKAVKASDIAIKISPEYIHGLITRANLHLELRNIDAAEKDFKKLVQLEVRDVQSYNKLGAILANKGQLYEAGLLWKMSLIIKPDQPEIKEALKTVETNRKNIPKKNEQNR